MSRDQDNDRPKKSWREIDQSKDKNRTRSESSGPGGTGSRGQRSAAYSNYKTQLNKLFDGGGLPQLVADRLGAQNVAAPAQTRKSAAAAICEAKAPKAVRAALEAYEAAHGFPEDEEVLAKLLDMSDEILVLQALQVVEKLVDAKSLKRGASLKARIKTAQLTLDDPDIRQTASRLLTKL